MHKEVSPNLIPADFEKLISKAVESILKNTPSIPPDTPEVLTVQGAAKFLGLSPSTIYSYISKRTIPHVKRNGSVWLLRSKLMEWLKEGEKKTFSELCK